MKLKTCKLLLLFLAAGLFVSSKETAVKSKATCRIQCKKDIADTKIKRTEKKQAPVVDSPLLLAPGSYIFHY